MLALKSASAAAAVGQAATRQSSGPAATEYELQRAGLGQDLAQLREIQSIEAKIERKRELLPKYDPWVAGVLEAAVENGKGVQDDIVAQTMVWAIDCGDFARALPRAAYVLRWSVTLPERIERTAGCFIAEEVAELALKTRNAGQPFPLEILLEVEELVDGQDMPDQVKAKLQKAIGLELHAAAESIELGGDGPAGAKPAAIDATLKRYRRALELDAKAGVKKRIEQLEREQRKLAEAAETNPPA
ncbi:phage terminase small subunit [Sphingosinicella sp. CPCC 101087]|uniref:phage terminase small subunit n=1 Tax=Sphingosinicella sp. CPCC 101087 TaxID=2497754 RepID=UPI00197F6F34|nr:phage terminase small subunit [Sphingosinicella sp. CPCC 101087]